MNPTLYLLAYTILLAGIGFFWCFVMLGREFNWRSLQFWHAAALGALAMSLVVKLQPIIQQNYLMFVARWQLSMLLIAFGAVLLGALLQESLKLGAMAFPRLISRNTAGSWAVLGAGAGLGFTVWEAWQTVAWPMAQQQVWYALPFVDRFFVIGTHIGASLLVAYGLHARRFWPFFVLAVGLHTASSYIVSLYYQWIIGIAVTEIFVGLVAIITTALVGYLYRKRYAV